jgi:hypothetical protein
LIAVCRVGMGPVVHFSDVGDQADGVGSSG